MTSWARTGRVKVVPESAVVITVDRRSNRFRNMNPLSRGGAGRGWRSESGGGEAGKIVKKRNNYR
jgi:hypothetical protein